MKEGVIYESPDITEGDRKRMKKFIRYMEEIDRQRAKMTPEERAKQDKELAGLHSKMQAGIDE
ncbi:MAG: hypothetical protein AB1432_05550 [Bacteroidota bacterium]|jgi:hypothetical protein